MLDNQQDQGAILTNVDIVYCIDATQSMSPCISKTKETAIKLHTDIVKAFEGTARRLNDLRLKIIVFRDYSHDGEDAIRESNFFNLPDEMTACANYIENISVSGGGPIPESSLEALHLAMNSDWVKSGEGDSRRRHVIVLFTDAPAHKLDDYEYRSKAENNPLYPTDSPKTLDEFIDEWDNPDIMDQRARRMILLAPDEEPWGELAESINQCQFACTQAGDGLSEVENNAILELITSSVVQQQ